MSIARMLNRFAELVKVRYLGLGLLWSWIYCLWFSPAVFSFDDGAAELSTWLISLGCSAAGLFVLAVRPGRVRSLSSAWLVVAPVGVSLSTFVLLFFQEGLLAWVGAAVGGALTAFLWVQWGELYCALEGEAMEACVPSSAIVVVVVASLCIALPSSVAGPFVAFVPLLSGVLLLVCHGDERFTIPPFELSKTKKGLTGLLVKLGIVGMACSMASSFVIALAAESTSYLFGSQLIVAVIAAALFAVAFSLRTILFAKRIDFATLYQWVVPVLVAALCLSVAGGRLAGTVAIVLAFSVAFMVDCLFMIIAARITSKGWCAPDEAFGIFRGFVQAGCLLAGLIAWAVSKGIAEPLTVLLAFIVMCVFALVAVVRLQEDLKNVTAPSASALASSSTSDDEAVERMAGLFKLSPREVDILRLLSKGRSVPYMRDALVISKSTIETHIKHLYAKTDVHSRQELIDLLEEHRSSAS